MENPKPRGQTYDKWLGEQAKPSHRELLRQAIDKAMEHRPENLDALLDLLRDAGCEVSKRGTAYRLKLPGWEKAARLHSGGSAGDFCWSEDSYTWEKTGRTDNAALGQSAGGHSGQAPRR